MFGESIDKNSIASYIALVPPLAVFIAALYDFAFFSYIGINISQIPSTLSYHIKSSINFLIFAFLIILLVIHMLPIVSGRERLKGDKLKDFFIFVKESWMYYLFQLYCCYILIFKVDGFGLYGYAFFIYVFVYDIFTIFYAKKYYEKYGNGFSFFKILLMFLVVVYVTGLNDAEKIKSGKYSNFFSTTEFCRNCYLLRSYDEYFVFWDASDTGVKFVHKDYVKTITLRE